MRSARSAPASQRRPSGPPHKPVTYVEQLKNINKAATMRTQQGKDNLDNNSDGHSGDDEDKLLLW